MYVCPSCKGELRKGEGNTVFLECLNKGCRLLHNKFDLIGEKPVLIPYELEDCIFKNIRAGGVLNFGSKRRSPSVKALKYTQFIKRIFIGRNSQTTKNFQYLIRSLKANSKLLIVGGGTVGSGMEEFHSYCVSHNISCESIDVYYSENITVVADAHYLPYLNEYFDMVIVQAVLEHVVNPSRVVSEIFRVLSTEGIVYSETPFIQSVHEGPYDFTRFTHSGHRWLFKQFEEIRSGSVHGAFSSTLFIFSYALTGLFKSKYIGIVIRILFNRLCLLLDGLVGKKHNIDTACGCYFMGKKPKVKREFQCNSWIASYYRGSQS